jgi:hypothetical protein
MGAAIAPPEENQAGLPSIDLDDLRIRLVELLNTPNQRRCTISPSAGRAVRGALPPTEISAHMPCKGVSEMWICLPTASPM